MARSGWRRSKDPTARETTRGAWRPFLRHGRAARLGPGEQQGVAHAFEHEQRLALAGDRQHLSAGAQHEAERITHVLRPSLAGDGRIHPGSLEPRLDDDEL